MNAEPGNANAAPRSGGVAALVPAAGSGARLGGERKQFRLLGGKPVLVQALRVLDQHPGIDRIVVAGPEEGVPELVEAFEREELHKVRDVVPGGSTRQDSVGRALAALPAAFGIVLVHDAVRPFLEPQLIDALLEVVGAQGAAALALPVADTLRRVAGGSFGDTVSREGLFRMQTPQGFRRDWLEAAHDAARREGFTGTDEVELVQRIGYRVGLVRGSARNIKITTREDWAMAPALWRSRPNPV